MFYSSRSSVSRPGSTDKLAYSHACMGICVTAAFGGRSQQEDLEQVEAANREKRQKLKATKITGDVNADRVKQLRALSVKVPGSGSGAELEGAKEVREVVYTYLGVGTGRARLPGPPRPGLVDV